MFYIGFVGSTGRITLGEPRATFEEAWADAQRLGELHKAPGQLIGVQPTTTPPQWRPRRAADPHRGSAHARVRLGEPGQN